jgi:hypothetical protein|tara:strand:+ start:385 stop:603 length:219 start_codon:yes stop_codon:yes gene_type:complete
MSFPLMTNIKDSSDTFEVIDEYKNYQVISKPRIVIKRESIQRCKLCGKEMLSFIIDHLRKEHPDEYAKEKKA